MKLHPDIKDIDAVYVRETRSILFFFDTEDEGMFSASVTIAELEAPNRTGFEKMVERVNKVVDYVKDR